MRTPVDGGPSVVVVAPAVEQLARSMRHASNIAVEAGVPEEDVQQALGDVEALLGAGISESLPVEVRQVAVSWHTRMVQRLRLRQELADARADATALAVDARRSREEELVAGLSAVRAAAWGSALHAIADPDASDDSSQNEEDAHHRKVRPLASVSDEDRRKFLEEAARRCCMFDEEIARQRGLRRGPRIKQAMRLANERAAEEVEEHPNKEVGEGAPSLFFVASDAGCGTSYAPRAQLGPSICADELSGLMAEAVRRAAVFDDELQQQRQRLERNRHRPPGKEAEPVMIMHLVECRETLARLAKQHAEGSGECQQALTRALAKHPHGSSESEGWRQLSATWKQLQDELALVSKDMETSSHSVDGGSAWQPIMSSTSNVARSSSSRLGLDTSVGEAAHQELLNEAARRAAVFDEELRQQQLRLHGRRRRAPGHAFEPLIAGGVIEDQQELVRLANECAAGLAECEKRLESELEERVPNAKETEGWQQLVALWQNYSSAIVAANDEVGIPTVGVNVNSAWRSMLSNVTAAAASKQPRLQIDANASDADRQALLVEAARRAAVFHEDLQQQRQRLCCRKRSVDQGIAPLTAGQFVKERQDFQRLTEGLLDNLAVCERCLVNALMGCARESLESDAWQQLLCLWQRFQSDLIAVGKEVGVAMTELQCDSIWCSIKPDACAAEHMATLLRRPRFDPSVREEDRQNLLVEATRRAAAFDEQLQQQRQRRQRRLRAQGKTGPDHLVEQVPLDQRTVAALAQEHADGMSQSLGGLIADLAQGKLDSHASDAWQELVATWTRLRDDLLVVTREVGVDTARQSASFCPAEGPEQRHRKSLSVVGNADERREALADAARRVATFDEEVQRQRLRLRQRRSPPGQQSAPLAVGLLMGGRSDVQQLRQELAQAASDCQHALQIASTDNHDLVQITAWQQLGGSCEQLRNEVAHLDAEINTDIVDLNCYGAAWKSIAQDSVAKALSERRYGISSNVDEVERYALLSEAARRAAAFDEEMQQQKERLERRRRLRVNETAPLAAGQRIVDCEVFERLAQQQAHGLMESEQALLRGLAPSSLDVEETEAWQQLVCLWKQHQEVLDKIRQQAAAGSEQIGDDCVWRLAVDETVAGESSKHPVRSDAIVNSAERRRALAEAARCAAVFEEEVQRQRQLLKRRRRTSKDGEALRFGHRCLDRDTLARLLQQHKEGLAHCEEALAMECALGKHDTHAARAWQGLVGVWHQLEQDVVGATDEVRSESNVASDVWKSIDRDVNAQGVLGGSLQAANSMLPTAAAPLANDQRRHRIAASVTDSERCAALNEGARCSAVFDDEVDKQRQALQCRRQSRREQAERRKLKKAVEGHVVLEQLAQDHAECLRVYEQSVNKALQADQAEVMKIEAWGRTRGVGFFRDDDDDRVSSEEAGTVALASVSSAAHHDSSAQSALSRIQLALGEARQLLYSVESSSLVLDSSDGSCGSDVPPVAVVPSSLDRLACDAKRLRQEVLHGDRRLRRSVACQTEWIPGAYTNDKSGTECLDGPCIELLRDIDRQQHVWGCKLQSDTELEAQVVAVVDRWRERLRAARPTQTIVTTRAAKQGTVELDGGLDTIDQQIVWFGDICRELLEELELLFEAEKFSTFEGGSNTKGLESRAAGVIDNWAQRVGTDSSHGALVRSLVSEMSNAAKDAVQGQKCLGTPLVFSFPSCRDDMLDAWHRCLRDAAERDAGAAADARAQRRRRPPQDRPGRGLGSQGVRASAPRGMQAQAAEDTGFRQLDDGLRADGELAAQMLATPKHLRGPLLPETASSHDGQRPRPQKSLAPGVTVSADPHLIPRVAPAPSVRDDRSLSVAHTRMRPAAAGSPEGSGHLDAGVAVVGQFATVAVGNAHAGGRGRQGGASDSPRAPRRASLPADLGRVSSASIPADKNAQATPVEKPITFFQSRRRGRSTDADGKVSCATMASHRLQTSNTGFASGIGNGVDAGRCDSGPNEDVLPLRRSPRPRLLEPLPRAPYRSRQPLPRAGQLMVAPNRQSSTERAIAW